MKSNAPKVFDKILGLIKAMNFWICNAMILKSTWAYRTLILPKWNIIESTKPVESAIMQKTNFWKNPERSWCT